MIARECFQCIHVNKEMFMFHLQIVNLLVCSDHKPLLKLFTGHNDNNKCNLWGLEAAATPRRFKVQHIKKIAKILADLVTRLKVVDFIMT